MSQMQSQQLATVSSAPSGATVPSSETRSAYLDAPQPVQPAANLGQITGSVPPEMLKSSSESTQSNTKPEGEQSGDGFASDALPNDTPADENQGDGRNECGSVKNEPRLQADNNVGQVRHFKTSDEPKVTNGGNENTKADSSGNANESEISQAIGGSAQDGDASPRAPEGMNTEVKASAPPTVSILTSIEHEAVEDSVTVTKPPAESTSPSAGVKPGAPLQDPTAVVIRLEAKAENYLKRRTSDEDVTDEELKKARRGGKMFQCSGFGDCKMCFSRSEHLARHIRKHTGERPFQCKCGRAFSRLDNLRQHIYTVHAGDPQNYQTIRHTMRAAAEMRKEKGEANSMISNSGVRIGNGAGNPADSSISVSEEVKRATVMPPRTSGLPANARVQLQQARSQELASSQVIPVPQDQRTLPPISMLPLIHGLDTRQTSSIGSAGRLANITPPNSEPHPAQQALVTPPLDGTAADRTGVSRVAISGVPNASSVVSVIGHSQAHNANEAVAPGTPSFPIHPPSNGIHQSAPPPSNITPSTTPHSASTLAGQDDSPLRVGPQSAAGLPTAQPPSGPQVSGSGRPQPMPVVYMSDGTPMYVPPPVPFVPQYMPHYSFPVPFAYPSQVMMSSYGSPGQLPPQGHSAPVPMPLQVPPQLQAAMPAAVPPPYPAS